MLWKILLFFPVWLFVGSFLPITTLSQAQSLILVTFAVIGVGEGEAGEILLVHSRPASQEGRTLQAYLTLQNAARSDSNCTQTVQVPLIPIPGLNSLTLYRENGSVFVNDDEVIEELDKCFDDAKRVIFQVRFPHPSASEPNDGQDPGEPRVGLPNIVSQAVYDRATGKTAASIWVDHLGQARWYKFSIKPASK